MGAIVYSRAADLVALAGLKGVGGHLTGSKLGIFSNDITPGKDTAIGDVVAAAYTGYALSAAVTLGTAYIDENGVPTLPATSLAFLQTGMGALDTGRGLYLVGDPSGTPYLIQAMRFPSSVQFDRTNRGLAVIPAYQIKRTGTPTWKCPAADQVSILNALTATGKMLDAAEVALFQSNTIPDQDTTLASMTECTFSGYARSSAVSWFTAARADANSPARVRAASVQFLQTGTGTTNTAYVWGLIGDPLGTPYLICSQRFDTPVAFAMAGKAVQITPEFSLPLAV